MRRIQNEDEGLFHVVTNNAGTATVVEIVAVILVEFQVVHGEIERKVQVGPCDGL